MSRKLGDYDIWFKPCDNCGYDTGKATITTENRCWKCGHIIYRDYSERALKIKLKGEVMEGNITILKKHYLKLRLAEEKLIRLENGGVDNWDWYSEALNPANEPNMENWEIKERERIDKL